MGHLEEYIASLPVTAGVRTALTVKLETAAAFYDNQQNEQAVNMLGAFISLVDSLRSDGVLTTEQAGNLTGAATTVIDTQPTS